MTDSAWGYTFRDLRKNSEEYSGEVCRICLSRDVHVTNYSGVPTPACIVYLRDQITSKDLAYKKLVEDNRKLERVYLAADRAFKMNTFTAELEAALAEIEGR